MRMIPVLSYARKGNQLAVNITRVVKTFLKSAG